jgi:hypothetical protein
MNLDTLIDRAQDVRQSATEPGRAIKQRMAEAAAELSRAGDNQQRVELLQEAVLAITKLCYDADPDGQPANLDSRTYRLLVPAPWGRVGWKRWGLRAWEAEILRQILIVRCQMRRVEPLFDYNDQARTWHVNLQHYGRLDLALMYWKQNPITLREWRRFADVYRAQAHARTIRNRGAGGSA